MKISFLNTIVALVFCALLLESCGNRSNNNQQNHQQQAAHQHHSHSTTSGANSSQGNSGETAVHDHSSPNPHAMELNGPSDPAASIPEFEFFILRSGIKFQKDDLDQGHKHVFVLFDPSCTYCQHEARDIGKNLDKFKNTSFYFISMNDPGLMSTFFSRYAKELENKENVHMLYDRNVQFVNKFHVPSQFPATYVYDSKHMLKTYWNGVKSEADIVNEILK